MSEGRVYTHIGKLEAELGNTAFAAAYSAYLGNCVSLQTLDDEVEWLGPKSAEFHFTAGGKTRSLLDVGYVEWLDDVAPNGVMLIQRRTGNGFFVQIEDIALRHPAGLLRRVHVANLTHGALHFERMCPLDWTLRGRTEVLAEAPGAVVSRSGAERGIFISGAGFTPEAESGALDTGRLVSAESRTLARGEYWRLPVLWMAPFSGPIGEAWLRTQGRMTDAAHQWEAWHDEREALRSAPGEAEDI